MEYSGGGVEWGWSIVGVEQVGVEHSGGLVEWGWGIGGV